MLTLPDGFESVLINFIHKIFGRHDLKRLSRGVAELNRYFTRERSSRPKNYFNRKELRSGYLLYFLPINALKISGLLQEIPWSFFRGGLDILDLGSGPATASIGALLHMGRRRVRSVVLVDQNQESLRDGRNLLLQLCAAHICPKPERLETVVNNLEDLNRVVQLKAKRFDLILLTNVLNEFRNLKTREHLVLMAKQYLKPNGVILIVEPALHRPTRELMELHDVLLKRSGFYVHAPCLHQAKCPMRAAGRRDWCHTYLEWQRPSFITRVDQLVGIRKDYLKASYLLLGLKAAPSRSTLWRVVSGPLNSKGKTERLLCGEQALPHLLRATRLDRDASPANQAFAEAQRGDIIATECVDRIHKQTQVRKLRGSRRSFTQLQREIARVTRSCLAAGRPP